jgi:hypothetical protein
MNIENLLELNLDLIRDEDHSAMEVLRTVWARSGCPTEAEQLILVLRATLDQCSRAGYSYPRIFLLRKGQLTRGEWKPRKAVPITEVKWKVPSHPAIPDEWIRQAEKHFLKGKF